MKDDKGCEGMKNKMKSLLKETVSELVRGDFNKIQERLQEDLTIDDLKDEMAYWGSLTIPPDTAYEKGINFIKYKDGSGYALEFELWVDYKQSDLTLSCSGLFNEDKEVYSFTIENLHVL